MKVKENPNLVDNRVDLALKALDNRSLCAAAQAENIKVKLLKGIPVRMAANGAIFQVMRRGGAKGCEVMISGKVRGQRAKAMKYTQGFMISTGQPKNEFIDEGRRHCELRQGIIGVKVKIMLSGITNKNVKKPMPDEVKIHEPKEDEIAFDEPTGITA